MTFATSGTGTTSPTGPQTYNAGQQVAITATPGSGYIFQAWSANPTTSVTFSNQNSASTTASGITNTNYDSQSYSINKKIQQYRTQAFESCTCNNTWQYLTASIYFSNSVTPTGTANEYSGFATHSDMITLNNLSAIEGEQQQ